PYPYRRRRRRGDLTFLPGGGGPNPPTLTKGRGWKRPAAGRLNQFFRAEKILIYFLIFKPHVKHLPRRKNQKPSIFKKKTNPTK
ncbi:hypothetical protein ACVGV8_09060, partial [Enterobacter intestinihominis]